MKKTFTLKCGTFGAGRTKICVPIVEASQSEIWKKAEEIVSVSADIVEWRGDFYEDIFSPEKVMETLAGLKERLADKDILFTFRTKGEGGNLAVDPEIYYELNQQVASSGCVSMVDLEMYLNESRTADVIRSIQKAGCRVITSSHDFYRTPMVDEMVARLMKMEEAGADVAKLAVMPKSRQNVLELLEASVKVDGMIHIPYVTMSMSELGVISRVAGQLTGSAMTFASAGTASAPGQIPIQKMAAVLDVLQ